MRSTVVLAALHCFSTSLVLFPAHVASHSSSSRGVGDYIASGLGGLENVKSLGRAQTTTRSHSTFHFTGNSSSTIPLVDSDTGSTASLAATGTPISVDVDSPANSSTTRLTKSSMSLVSSAGNASIVQATASATSPFYDAGNSSTAYATGTGTGNATIHWPAASDADQCWLEWKTYWSEIAPTPTSYSTTFKASTYTVTESLYATATTSYTTSWQYVTTLDAAGFPYTTETISKDTTITIPTQGTLESVETDTYTEPPESYLFFTTLQITTATPSCALPTSYSKCQKKWTSWVDIAAAPLPPPPCSARLEWVSEPNGQLTFPPEPACRNAWITSTYLPWYHAIARDTPACTQASITGAECLSLKDAYVHGQNSNLYPSIAQNSVTLSNGYYRVQTRTETGWTWPTHHSFAPGCTLGCGRCAVTGGTIQLLYFPPGLSHPATAPVTFKTMNTTLTSPTMYISFATAYASDACKGIGPTKTSTIVAIPTTDQISSVWGQPSPYGAHAVNMPSEIDTYTTSFNFNDLLQTPVPYSIYQSQPWCASWRFSDYLRTKHCPTTLPYRPIIVVPDEVLQKLDPAWASCSADLRGLYDPPRALRPATIATPLIPTPNVTPTQSATPASTVASSTPTKTTPSEASVDPPTSVPAAPTDSGTSGDTSVPSDPTDPGDPTAQPEQSGSAGEDTTAATDPATGGVDTTTQLPNSPVDPSEPTQGLSTPATSPSTDEPNSPPASPSSSLNAAGVLSSASAQASNAEQTASDPTDAPVQSATATAAPSSADVASPGGDPSTPSAGDSTSPPAVVIGGTTVALGQATTVGDVTLSVATDSAGAQSVVVGGQTLAPGQTTAIGDIPVSVAPASAPAGAASTFVAGGQTIVVAPAPTASSATVLGGSVTLSRGSPATVLQGTTYSLGSSGVVVNGVPSGAPASPVVIDGSVTVQPGSEGTVVQGSTYSLGSSGLVIDGTPAVTPSGVAIIDGSLTLQSGSPGTVIDGNTYSLGSSGVMVNGVPTTLPSSAVVIDGSITLASEGHATVFHGTTYSLGDSGVVVNGVPTETASSIAVVDGSVTLHEGDPATVFQGTTYSLGSSGVIINGQPATPLSQGSDFATTIQAGSIIITATPGSPLAVDGSTIYSGGPAVVVSGETLSLGSSGLVVDGTSTIPLVDPLPATTIQIDSMLITATPGSPIVVDGKTIYSGSSAVVVSGETLSLGSSGLVVNGTSTIPMIDTTPAITAQVDSLLITASPGSPVVVDGITIFPGSSAVVIDGETLSLGSSGLVVNGTTTISFTSSSGGDPGTRLTTPRLGSGAAATTSSSTTSTSDSIRVTCTTALVLAASLLAVLAM